MANCYDKLITLLIFIVFMFEWVLKFRIWVLTVMIGTCIYGLLVIDGTYAPEFTEFIFGP